MNENLAKSFLKRFRAVHVLYNAVLHVRLFFKRLPKRVMEFILNPLPLRIVLGRALMRRMTFLPYAKRLDWDAVEGAHYGFCIYIAAMLAKALGIGRISVIEFGVAGGRGLLNAEYHARQVTRETGVEIEIYGFDLGSGLPQPRDYRDLPYHWQGGFYRMDVERLESRLENARLVLGDVGETVSTFFEKSDPAPVGCCLFDLDYFSSTVHAFGIFDGEAATRLPRVYCYFDDMIDNPLVAYNDFTGELLAIHEFNQVHPDRKIARLNGLSWIRRVPQVWNDKIFVFHDFAHPRYGEFVSQPDQDRPIRASRSARKRQP
jgi:hypothetical protein